MLPPHSTYADASENFCGYLGILGDKFPEEETCYANHGEPTHVHLEVVQAHYVAVLAETERVKSQVAGDTVFLVFHTQNVLIGFVPLQVVLSQGLVAKANQQHGELHLIQAQSAIQHVLSVCAPHLLEESTPVCSLSKDCQKSSHGKAAVFDFRLSVVVVSRLRYSSRGSVKNATPDCQVQWVETPM